MWEAVKISGLINGDITVEFKHFEQPSEYGINGGKISKLTMKRAGKGAPYIIANYDRGWDIEIDDNDQDAKAALSIVLNGFN